MAAKDNTRGGLGEPATKAAALTPNDDGDVAVVPRAFLVGVAGNAKITTFGGDTVVLVGLLAGVIYPIRILRLWSTSTTATDIIGLS